jgi:hypothetical protein
MCVCVEERVWSRASRHTRSSVDSRSPHGSTAAGKRVRSGYVIGDGLIATYLARRRQVIGGADGVAEAAAEAKCILAQRLAWPRLTPFRLVR